MITKLKTAFCAVLVSCAAQAQVYTTNVNAVTAGGGAIPIGSITILSNVDDAAPITITTTGFVDLHLGTGSTYSVNAAGLHAVADTDTDQFRTGYSGLGQATPVATQQVNGSASAVRYGSLVVRLNGGNYFPVYAAASYPLNASNRTNTVVRVDTVTGVFGSLSNGDVIDFSFIDGTTAAAFDNNTGNFGINVNIAPELNAVSAVGAAVLGFALLPLLTYSRRRKEVSVV